MAAMIRVFNSLWPLGLLLVSAGAVAASSGPSILAGAKPGLWEISGGPTGRTGQRVCLADVTRIAQLQHRVQRCDQHVVRNSAGLAEVHYSCAGGNFGQSKISLITPRSFRVETQGIADNAPFHYVVQARRLGECGGH